jgi:hypothetical protein
MFFRETAQQILAKAFLCDIRGRGDAIYAVYSYGIDIWARGELTGGEQVVPAISGRSSKLLYQLSTESHGKLFSYKKGPSETISSKPFFQWLNNTFYQCIQAGDWL